MGRGTYVAKTTNQTTKQQTNSLKYILNRQLKHTWQDDPFHFSSDSITVLVFSKHSSCAISKTKEKYMSCLSR